MRKCFLRLITTVLGLVALSIRVPWVVLLVGLLAPLVAVVEQTPSSASDITTPVPTSKDESRSAT